MYFLKEYISDGFDAGSKARIDCEKIIKQLNYKPLDLYFSNRLIYFKSIFKRHSELKNLNEGDSIIIQYPYYFKCWDKVFKKLQKLRNKNIKIIAIIHDIISLRSKNEDMDICNEMNLLNKFDYIISHNESMSKFLKDNGVKNKILNLEIFDYISDSSNYTRYDDFKKVYIAGNLSKNKSQYIYTDEFNKLNYKIYLYGPNFDEKIIKLNNNIEYKGCFPAESLGEQFGNGFGLVWDGNSIDECNGAMGEYLKYNNPHKTSMYLSTGMPIIIWKEAAMAKFIEENKLGICIESLKEIEYIFKNMSTSEYNEIKNNCNEISKKIREGYFLKKILKSI